MSKPWNEQSRDVSQEAMAGVIALKKPMSEWIREKTLDVPAMPQVIAQAMRLTGDPNTTVMDLQVLIEKDQSIAGRLLNLANSVMFQRTQQIKTIKDAIVRLGNQELKNTLFGLFVQTRLFTSETHRELINAEWRHSLAVAEISRRIAEAVDFDEDLAFLCGLLHDVGKAALMGQMKENIADPSAFSNLMVEEAMEGIHELAGAIAVKKWQLPEELVEAVVAHHHLERAKQHRRLALIVNVADVLAFRMAIGIEQSQLSDENAQNQNVPLLANHRGAKAIDLEAYRPIRELGVSLDALRAIENDADWYRDNIEAVIMSRKRGEENDANVRSAFKPKQKARGGSPTPQKGGSTNAVLWLAVSALVLGAAAIAVVFLTK